MTTTATSTVNEITCKDSFFQDSLNIKGKQSRLSYLTTLLVLTIIVGTAYIVLYALALYHNVDFNAFGSLFKVVLGIYVLSVLVTSSIRRCNDIGISPYWLLLAAIFTLFVAIALVLIPNNTFNKNKVKA